MIEKREQLITRKGKLMLPGYYRYVEWTEEWLREYAHNFWCHPNGIHENDVESAIQILKLSPKLFTAVKALVEHLLEQGLTEEEIRGPISTLARTLEERFALEHSGSERFIGRDVRRLGRVLWAIAARDRKSNLQDWPEWIGPQAGATEGIVVAREYERKRFLRPWVRERKSLTVQVRLRRYDGLWKYPRLSTFHDNVVYWLQLTCPPYQPGQHFDDLFMRVFRCIMSAINYNYRFMYGTATPTDNDTRWMMANYLRPNGTECPDQMSISLLLSRAGLAQICEQIVAGLNECPIVVGSVELVRAEVDGVPTGFRFVPNKTE